MVAADYPNLETTRAWPFRILYHVFYAYSNLGPETTTMTSGGDRDLFNEKSVREEILALVTDKLERRMEHCHCHSVSVVRRHHICWITAIMKVAQDVSNVKVHPKTDKPYDDVKILNISLRQA